MVKSVFQIGDKVRFVTGDGPVIQIIDIYEDCRDNFCCKWWNVVSGKFEKGTFSGIELVPTP